MWDRKWKKGRTDGLEFLGQDDVWRIHSGAPALLVILWHNQPFVFGVDTDSLCDYVLLNSRKSIQECRTLNLTQYVEDSSADAEN